MEGKVYRSTVVAVIKNETHEKIDLIEEQIFGPGGTGIQYRLKQWIHTRFGTTSVESVVMDKGALATFVHAALNVLEIKVGDGAGKTDEQKSQS